MLRLGLHVSMTGLWHNVLFLFGVMFCFCGSVAKWLERSPLTLVTRVRISSLPSKSLGQAIYTLVASVHSVDLYKWVAGLPSAKGNHTCYAALATLLAQWQSSSVGSKGLINEDEHHATLLREFAAFTVPSISIKIIVEMSLSRLCHWSISYM
jgi:hypothetical protein